MPPPPPTVDLEAFADSIEARLSTTVVGYAFVITRNGQAILPRSGGHARIAGGAGIPFTPDTRMIVFSVSKTITAIAALRRLHESGMSPTDLIGPWLPDEWNAPFQVQVLTFRDILSHRSGLRSTLTSTDATQSWTGMRDSIGNGTPLPKSYTYQNLNYALLQVIIPTLWQPHAEPPLNTATMTEDLASQMYRRWVRRKVLEPAGVMDADCHDPDRATETRLFHFPTDPVAIWSDPDDRRLFCASGGWYLSAMDLARVLVRLRHTETLLPAALRDQMDEFLMGWDGPSHPSGAHGTYYQKGGSHAATNQGFPTGGLTQIMVFPATGVEIALLVNSRGATENVLSTLIRDAYEAAIVR